MRLARETLMLKLSDTTEGWLFYAASSAENRMPRALRIPWLGCLQPLFGLSLGQPSPRGSPPPTLCSGCSTRPLCPSVPLCSPTPTLPTLCPAWNVRPLKANTSFLFNSLPRPSTAYHTSGKNPTKLSHYLG